MIVELRQLYYNTVHAIEVMIIIITKIERETIESVATSNRQMHR